jgi:NCK-associated protein 1
MRDCIIGNFRRRFHSMIRTDNWIQRPSVIESLLRRHLGIIHLAEQHISMDLTEGIREVLLAESFTGSFPNLQISETPVGTQGGGSAIEIVCNWYIENVIKDVSGIGVVFDATQNCFRSSQPIGSGCLAEAFTDKRELKALVRLFGGYGIDKMDKMLREHTSALLNCIDSALRSNRDALEGLAGSVNSGDRIERDANLKQIIDLETLVDLCIQAGQAIMFRGLLVEAVGTVLQEKVPLMYSLLKGLALQLPDEIPDKNEVIRLRRVASSVGVGDKHDAEWVHSILTESGTANDNSWILLPYLYAAFMVSSLWNGAVYDVNIGGFNNNLHCLSR